MSNENKPSGRSTRPEDKQPTEGSKHNPIAAFLAKSSIVARKELPVVGGAVIALSIIAILVSIKFISVEFTVILTLATIVKASFQAGAVWQRLRRK